MCNATLINKFYFFTIFASVGYESKTWGSWISGFSNRSYQQLQDSKIGFALTNGNEYLDGKQIYTIASAGFTVLKQEDFNDAKTEVASE